MQRTRIEWVKNSDGTQGYSWNPIKGLCPVDCKLPDGKSYCYARRMYQRFGWDSKVELDGELFGSCQDAFAPNINVYEKLGRIKSGSKIFICSTFELFHPSVFKKWRDAIFQAIKEHSQHTFQILTKFPQNIDREMPENVWLGVSITKNEDVWRRNRLVTTGAKVKFISFEPLLERLAFALYPEIDWVIIGKLTGHGDKYNPKQGWVREIVKNAYLYDIPIFLKNNLKSIWGDNLIQEMPASRRKDEYDNR